jgi:hypothetical protein
MRELLDIKLFYILSDIRGSHDGYYEEQTNYLFNCNALYSDKILLMFRRNALPSSPCSRGYAKQQASNKQGVAICLLLHA